jgi:hypothetical protein
MMPLSRVDLPAPFGPTTAVRAFPISVFDLVAMGLWRRVGPWRSLGRHRGAVELERADLAHDALEQGRLAGAVRPDHRRERTGAERAVEVVSGA